MNQSVMTSEQPRTDDEILGPAARVSIVRELLRVIFIWRRTIWITTLVCVGLAAAVILFFPPRFSSTAVVILDQRQNNVENATAVLSGLPVDPTAIQNQVEIIKSRTVAGRVVDKLGMAGTAKQNALATPPWYDLESFNVWSLSSKLFSGDQWQVQSAREQAIDRLVAGLSVSAKGLSSAIEIRVVSGTPVKSAAIANELADAYVQYQLDAKAEATRKATQWLTVRLQELAKQSQLADSAVQAYKAENGLSENPDGSLIVDQQLGDVGSQLVQAKLELAQKEASYAQAALLSRTGEQADTSEVIASPVIAQLRNQEAGLIRVEADLGAKYGPMHPKMIDLKAQKTKVEQKIAQEARRIVKSQAGDVAVARAKVASVSETLRDLETKSAAQNKLRVKLAALESSANSARSIYQTFLGRLDEVSGQAGISSPDAHIISQAQPPASANFPNNSLALVAAIPGGLLLGLILAILSETGVTSKDYFNGEIERLRLASVQGAPHVSPQRLYAAKAEAAAEQNGDVNELWRSIRHAYLDESRNVIMVTSALPDEGAATLSLSLARLAAQEGMSTILVDANFGQATIAELVQLPSATQGIADVLSGRAAIEACLVKDPSSEVLVLPCLAPTQYPTAIMTSERLEWLMKTLKNLVDLVVVTASPVHGGAGTMDLARLADASVLAVRWSKTPRPTVAKAARLIEEAQGFVAGVAFTGVKRQTIFHEAG